MTNQTAMQYFEWYLPSDGQHWNNLAEDAQHLADLGISHVWMPPAFKATNKDDVGYGVYDLFDLGEFDQKGTIRTKYGLKEEYLNAINQLKNVGIIPMADVVLNHKAAADKLETFYVVEVDPEDRTKVISEPFEIEGWTHFTFDGRQKAYNDFEWHWYHFNGTDFDAKRNKKGIYLIQGDNKGWAHNDLVDNENGNFDYLMFANLDYRHPEVIENIYEWADWFVETTGVQGFRMDAIKHIDYFFMRNFIRDVKEKQGQDFYVFGEFWNAKEVGERSGEMTDRVQAVADYLDECGIANEPCGDILYKQWNKLMVNDGLNQAAAAFDQPYGGLRQPGEAQDMMRAAMQEVIRLANLEGVPLPPDNDVQFIDAMMPTFNPEGMPSMRQDVLAKRPTEVEEFAGVVRQRAKKYGMPTPANDFFYTRIREIEAGYDQ